MKIVELSKDNLITEGEFKLVDRDEDTEMFILVEDVYSHLVRSVQFVRQGPVQTFHGPFHNLITTR